MVSPPVAWPASRILYAWVALRVGRNCQFALCHLLLIAPNVCW
jgi:hypothetical protein